MNNKQAKRLRYILTKNSVHLQCLVEKYSFLQERVERNKHSKLKDKLSFRDMKKFWYSLPWNQRKDV